MKEADPVWSLVLYVSGASPRSAEAIETIRSVCDLDLAGRVKLEILDVGEHLDLALRDNVMAVPTLIRRAPLPRRRLVDHLSDANQVRVGLDLAPRPRAETGGRVEQP